MKIQNAIFLYSLAVVLFLLGCDSGPKVIESESTGDASNIPAFNNIPTANDAPAQEHKVVIDEVLNTDKYSYLNVSENGEKFWVAIQKMDVKVGDTYYYKGGLLKKNFYSQEYDRVFETVYLVSEIWKQPGGADSPVADNALSKKQAEEAVNLEVGNIKPAEGAIKIAELFANKEKYNGKTIKVTGKCIKVNPMIMNRNWLHIKDSSTDKFDLTVTTTENVALGAVITLEGTIALDRDFGAGYRYDILMEGAVLR